MPQTNLYMDIWGNGVWLSAHIGKPNEVDESDPYYGFAPADGMVKGRERAGTVHTSGGNLPHNIIQSYFSCCFYKRLS